MYAYNFVPSSLHKINHTHSPSYRAFPISHFTQSLCRHVHGAPPSAPPISISFVAGIKIMPRRKAQTQKKTAKPGVLDIKADEVARVTPKQALQMVTEDFEAQVPRMLDSTCRKYERECLKGLRQLPDKTCVPSEIYRMLFTEFLEYGGTIETVMAGLREKKRREFDQGTAAELREEHIQENIPDTKRGIDVGVFQTPAIQTRSHTSHLASTVKRRPNQLEEIRMIALSKTTGSPVDEKLVMETFMDDMMGQIMKTVLPKISSKTAKSQTTKAIEASLSELKQEMRQKSELSLVTPSLGAARKRRMRK